MLKEVVWPDMEILHKCGSAIVFCGAPVFIIAISNIDVLYRIENCVCVR